MKIIPTMTAAITATPPTAPPAIAPTGVFFAGAGGGDVDVTGAEELETVGATGGVVGLGVDEGIVVDKCHVI